MKINRNGEALSDVERIRQQAKGNASHSSKGGNAAEILARPEEDTVNVSVGKDIAALATARAERLAELKELVQSGQYNPDSRLVAGAIDSVISEEVVLDKIENI